MADEVKLEGELVVLQDSDNPEEPMLYTHAEFLNVFHDELLTQFDNMLHPEMGRTAVVRALRNLRTPAAHSATLNATLRRLVDTGTPVPLDELGWGKHAVVAVFPKP